MGFPLSAAHLDLAQLNSLAKYLRNSFIPAIVTQSTEQFMQKTSQQSQMLVILPLILPALESNQTTHPKGSSDNFYTKWFIENQNTSYRLGKLHKMVICCLLTKKISIFISNARLFLNSFSEIVAFFLCKII